MTDTPRTVPIACTLAPGELGRRSSELLPGLLRRAAARHPIDGGYRIEFAKDTPVVEIARVIDAERHCCQFLAFHLEIEPALGAIRLDITGPPGTRDFLASLL